MSAPRSRCCRRTILRVIALLAAGAALNVAVAWGCAIIKPLPKVPTQVARKHLGQNKSWTIARFDRGGLCFTESGCWNMMKTTDDSATLPQDVMRPGSRITDVGVNRPPVISQVEWEVLCGWPFWAMGGLKRNEWHLGPVGIETLDYAVLLEPSHEEQPFRTSVAYRQKLLPLRTLWPGFAINTLFYAVVLWLLFAGPFALRRMIRRRRGQCPTCAYPIGTSEVCTECGAPVMPAQAGIQSRPESE